MFLGSSIWQLLPPLSLHSTMVAAMRKSAGNDHAKNRVGCEKKIITNKGAWSKQEDQKLIDYIKNHGEGCWSSLPQPAGLLRCGKSCRLRWVNYLKPDVKRGNFGEDEEDLIIKLHALLGNRWSLIAGRLPGRTDNEVKNYWNSHLKKKLMRMGIDPNNHRLGERAPAPGPAPDNNNNSAVACGVGSGASKTISMSLPDLNLNCLSVEGPSSVDHDVDDQQMQLLMTHDQANNINTTHKDLQAAPFTTLLLFG